MKTVDTKGERRCLTGALTGELGRWSAALGTLLDFSMCILYDKTVIINVALSVNSVKHSNKLSNIGQGDSQTGNQLIRSADSLGLPIVPGIWSESSLVQDWDLNLWNLRLTLGGSIGIILHYDQLGWKWNSDEPSHFAQHWRVSKDMRLPVLKSGKSQANQETLNTVVGSAPRVIRQGEHLKDGGAKRPKGPRILQDFIQPKLLLAGLNCLPLVSHMRSKHLSCEIHSCCWTHIHLFWCLNIECWT